MSEASPVQTPAPVATGPACLIVNPKSGRNSRDRAAVEQAREALGPDASIRVWDARSGPEQTLRGAIRDGAGTIVAAGGDGTASAVASALMGTGVPMAVLPLGTFNYFARGLGFSEDPTEAARQIREGVAHDIAIGTVNGQIFLNNASLGIYPRILRERESVYATWGRSRIAAHWSVIRTFMRFRKPMRVTLDFGEGKDTRRTALVFVGRSAFQLRTFGLAGEGAISNDDFAVLVARAERRRDLVMLTLRLAAHRAEEGRDYDLYRTPKLDIEVHRRGAVLLAFDGEKRREHSPFRFRMSRESLRVVLPSHREDVSGT